MFFISLLLQICQDFSFLFGPETAAKLLEKWHTAYKGKVIREAESLTTTPVLQSLLKSARNQYNDESSEDIPGIQLKANEMIFNASCHTRYLMIYDDLSQLIN